MELSKVSPSLPPSLSTIAATPPALRMRRRVGPSPVSPLKSFKK